MSSSPCVRGHGRLHLLGRDPAGLSRGLEGDPSLGRKRVESPLPLALARGVGRGLVEETSVFPKEWGGGLWRRPVFSQ